MLRKYTARGVYLFQNTVHIVLIRKNTSPRPRVHTKIRTLILGSRENTTLGGLYFPSNPK